MNPINPMKLLQLKSAWERFKSNHPKFPKFISAIYHRGLKEGTVIEIRVISPEGEELASNLKIQAEDIDLFRELKDIMNQP